MRGGSDCRQSTLSRLKLGMTASLSLGRGWSASK